MRGPFRESFMHYRHAFHAGNFADVVKHGLLVALLARLSAKATPWHYVDTHAGAGAYAPADPRAARTDERAGGLARLLAAPALASPALQTYVALARAHGLVPGSPLLAASLARPGDALTLYEAVPEVAAELKRTAAGALTPGASLSVRVGDGYRADALLPPLERRGLVLLDPPFERADEFGALEDFLQRASRRFAHGVYAVWYPYKKHFDAARFLRRVAAWSERGLANAVLDTGRVADGRMHACGLLVVNPPFGFVDDARAALAEMLEHLGEGRRAGAGVETQGLS